MVTRKSGSTSSGGTGLMVTFRTVADLYAFEALTAGGLVFEEADNWNTTGKHGVVERRCRLGAREFTLQRRKHPYKQKQTYRVKLGKKKDVEFDKVEGLVQAVEERFGVQCFLEYASHSGSANISLTSD